MSLLLSLAAAITLVSETGLSVAPKTAIVAVDAFPERIELDGRFDYAQLVLLARTAGGGVVDATRSAVLADVPDFLELDDYRLVRPVADGEGELVFKVDSETLRIPVSASGTTETEEPSFIQDVMPVLSRMGCNSGTCHGSAQGKNGFQLSLRGYDPATDHGALTDELAGRRFNPVAPDASLFLLKPTGRVPHEGGAVLPEASRAYELLRDWIAGGARLDSAAPRVASLSVFPEEPTLDRAGMSQQFAVFATYSDGRRRDVTAEAFFETSDTEVTKVDPRGVVTGLRRGEAAVLIRYEGSYAAAPVVVMGDREGWEWTETETFNWIDELVQEKLKAVRSLPGELCTDAEFLRRITLDLTGRLPSADEVQTFLLDDRDSGAKRNELIDRLIGSAAFVEHWTNRWCDLLQVNSKFLGDEGARRMRRWVQARVASNTPYDELVAEILGSSGSTYDSPQTAYFKVLREPDVVMENTTQLFLGVRFNCNKCHDHPFERWTQDDHWELAAYFAQVGRKNVEGAKLLPNGVVAGSKGIAVEETISDLEEGEVRDPDTKVVVAPEFPFEHAGTGAPDATRRARLVQWLTAPENPYFARSYVNRLWSYLLGRGIIEPVDDIRAGNPPSNPALLDRLEAEFIANDFDVRHMLRLICRSRTYQQSVKTNRWNADDRMNFSHATARRLPAEILFDAVHQAAGSDSSIQRARPGTRAAELVDSSFKAPDGFLDLFGRPARESSCECERKGGMSMGQALSLVNGQTVADAIQDPRSAVVGLATFERSPKRIVDELFLRYLGRHAEQEEVDDFEKGFDPKVRANLAALDPEALAAHEKAHAEWVASIRVHDWTALTPATVRATGDVELKHADGVVRATGPNPEKTTYTLAFWVESPTVSGLRLDVLPDDELPAKGPGRAENGNFVLNELRAAFVPSANAGAAKPLVLKNATADYSQSGWAVAGAIDGKPASGWAVMPRFGAEHSALFEVTGLDEASGPGLLVVSMEQHYGQRHTIGRFRLSVTDGEHPIRYHGLTAEAFKAMKTPIEERTPEQKDALHTEYVRRHPKVADSIRLGATQDLAWALSNSPAFLFNR